MTRTRWGNVEKAVVAYLAEGTGLPVYTETAGTMPARYLRIERIGGGAEWIDRDVDIEIRAVTAARGDLWDLVDEVDGLMTDLAANDATPGFYIDEVSVAFGFAWDPPDDASNCAAIGTYTLTVRPRPV